MSKIYSPDSAGKERTRLTKTIILALRELMKQKEPDDLTRDITAYVILALEEIATNIDTSVEAWEKRGYWVKADRFRLDWEWAGSSAARLRKAFASEDWGTIAVTAAQVAQKLNKVVIPQRHRLGTPWVGAVKLLK
ncbi:MAG TPA: hypothetical protein PKK59_01710 [Anaerolineaceae bacterium]|nr:hypothetical protein [Anaerolineaceae bacterium]